MSTVQPGEEVAFGGLYSSPQYSQEGHQEDEARLFTVAHGGRMRDNKLRESQSGYKEILFAPIGQPGSGAGYPGTLCLLHPCRFSRPKWIKL